VIGSKWKTISLYIRKFLGHLAVPNEENVDAADVPRRPVLPDPTIEPPDHAAVPAGEDLLRLENCVRRGTEEALPEAADRFLSDVALPVRRRARVLEHAVFRHGAH